MCSAAMKWCYAFRQARKVGVVASIGLAASVTVGEKAAIFAKVPSVSEAD